MSKKDEYKIVITMYKNGEVVNQSEDQTSYKVAAEVVFNDCVAQLETSEGCSMEETKWNDYDDDGYPFYNEKKLK